VITVGKDAELDEVARLLSDNRVSGLPVVDDKGRVIGVVSEADVLSLAGMKKGHTLRDVIRHILGEPLPERRSGNSVRDIMSSPAITTGPDTGIKDAARVMDEKKIKRLPVVDSEGMLRGIVSRADIVKAMSRR
jgi:CBS domain-containing protein